jgi:hypothetical protein
LEPPAAGRVDRAAGAMAAGYVGLVTGACPLDLGIGRRVRPLGPQLVEVAAPREAVFDLIAKPYLGRTPRALADKVRVLERGSDMVLAAHVTPLGGRLGLVAQTVETVRFTRPERVDFRLVRGPVPHVVEAFTVEEQPDGAGTLLVYQGQLAADLWRLASGGASWSPAAGSRRSRPRWQRSRLKPNGGQQQPRPLGVRAAASRRPGTIEIGRAAPQTAYSDASREAPAPVIGQAERVPSALVRRHGCGSLQQRSALG